MTPLYQLKFRCERCGERNKGQVREGVFDLYILASNAERADFLAGKDLENRRQPN